MHRHVFQLSVGVFVMTLAVCGVLLGGADYVTVPDQAKVPIFTPSYAQRQVEKVRLANGLEVYLISDPRAEKSAAAMIVRVGSWEDPDTAPGMAHFVEHMLFLGTKKYPEESDFDRFISQHGGITNASTHADHTEYVFSVNTEAFTEALDRFASFFREPLFNASGVDREINAIDQEFARIARDDNGRAAMVLQSLGNPKHPNSRFTAGNKLTLSKVPREQLMDWYSSHYSSNQMRLIVYSSLDLEVLRKVIVQDFLPIPNMRKPLFQTNEPLYTADQQATFTYVDSLKDTRTLMLYWELPGRFAAMRETKPQDIVCYVLGHEGDKSLLASLKAEGLVESLACGASNYGTNNYAAYLEIQLTKKGLKEIDHVIERVFQSIDKLRERGVPSYLFNDVQQATLIRYQHQERRDAYNLVSELASGFVDEDLDTFPEKTFLSTRFDPQATTDFLLGLSPQKVQVILIAPAAQLHTSLQRREKWTNTPFSVQKVPSDQLKRWQELEDDRSVEVPAPNSYLPRSLKVLSKGKSADTAMPQPKVLIQDDFGLFYYAKDDYYQVPQVYCSFGILTPQVDDGDVVKAVLADLYSKAVQETLNRSLYPAQIGGLDFQVNTKTYQIGVDLYGFSEHAPDLLQSMINGMKNMRPLEDEFNRYKEALTLTYRNFAAETPMKQGAEVMAAILNKDYSTNKEKLRAIPRIGYEEFLKYIRDLFSQNYVKGMLYGNITEEQAKQMAAIIRTGLGGAPYPLKEHKRKEIADLSTLTGPRYLVEKSKISGNSIILAIESAPYSAKSQAVQSILAQGLSAPFFNTLRTQQQTGYAVGSWEQEMERHLFLIFAVESDAYDGRDILSRFELFLEGFQHDLGGRELGQQEFDHIKGALLATLQKPAQNLKEMGVLLGTLAIDYEGDFDWINKRITAMQALPYSEFLTTAGQMLSSRNKKRIAVVVRGASPPEKILEYTQTRSIKEARSGLEYVPAEPEK